MPSRVLITGVSGFIGRHLAAALAAAGHRVLGTGTAAAPDDALAAHLADYRPLEITRAEAVAQCIDAWRPEAAVHLAALSFVAHPQPLDFYRINVLGTQHLLDALTSLPEPPGRVLLASSATVYGRNAGGRVGEDTPPAPVNHYGHAKLAMEHLAATYAERLPLLSFRLFNTTGPGQREPFLVPKLVNHFARREPTLRLGNRQVSRDFSDVRDIAHVLTSLLTCPLPPDQHGRALNLASGQAIPLQALIDQLIRLTGHAPRIETDPALVRANEIARLCARTERLASLVGKRSLTPLSLTLGDMLKDAESILVKK